MQQHLFNVSERFSSTLDEVRGPTRKKHVLRRARAWINVSAARRTMAKGIGIGSGILLVGVMSLVGMKMLNQIQQQPNLG